MLAILEAVYTLILKAQPSLYIKRQQTIDLTELRCIYTYQRNCTYIERCIGQRIGKLKELVKGAIKQYYNTIQQQKKKHQNKFLVDNNNIWKAAKYLKSRDNIAFRKILQLTRADRTSIANYKEQVEELLLKFFPALLDIIEDKGLRLQRAPVIIPAVTIEEIEQQLFIAKSQKTLEEDSLLAIVQKEVWQVVKHYILVLFYVLLEDRSLSSQQQHAKIIPLKKLGKEDYIVAKVQRPILLLAMLGKVLESVVAERISYIVEIYSLLLTNYFSV